MSAESAERKGERCPHEELAAGWALIALEPHEEAVFRAHLSGCARCTEGVRVTEEVAVLLGGAVPQGEPPSHLRTRILDMAENTPQEQGWSPHGVTPNERKLTTERWDASRLAASRESYSAEGADRGSVVVPLDLARRSKVRRRRFALLAAAAVLALIAGGGVLGVRVGQVSGERDAQAQRASELSKVLTTLGDPTTRRAVLNDAEGHRVALLLSGSASATVMPMALSPNDTQRQVYVLWGTSGPSPVALATFDVPAGTQPETVKWPAGASVHNGYAISLETGRSAPATPTLVVASGQVS